MKLQIILCFGIGSVLFLGCSHQPSRQPAGLGHRTEELVFDNLTPYEFTENYPTQAQPMDFANLATYELVLKNKTPAPVLEGFVTCDSPFQMKTQDESTEHPGPSQVRFRLYDQNRAKSRFSILPSTNTNECRVYLKDPNQPSKVFGLRLVPRAPANQP